MSVSDVRTVAKAETIRTNIKASFRGFMAASGGCLTIERAGGCFPSLIPKDN